MNRKEFFRFSTSIVAGLGVSNVFGDVARGQEPESTKVIAVDDSYLRKGLNALARAHQMSAMAGHLGASLVAGSFIRKQRPDLDPEVFRGIQGDLDRVMGGESVFGSKMSKKAKITEVELFEDFPKERSDERLIDGIADALAKNIGSPRESGHNVIFASIAIHALKERPEFATPSIVEGICKLIRLFDQAHPGSGYYGKTKGRIRGDKISLHDENARKGTRTPTYTDVEGMVDAVIDEIINQDPNIHQQGYGGLVHVNNHAAAIADLAQYGYPELMAAAIASHRQHLRLWQNLPNVADEFGPSPYSEFNPYTSAYWTSGKVPYDRALLTHRVKTMFGFDGLTQAIDDERKEQQAYAKLRYMM